MSGSGPPGSGGHPPGTTPEQLFGGNVRTAAAGWHERLRSAPSLAAAAEAIGREAGELRRIAEGRGWGALAKKLQDVEVISRQAPPVLIQVVAELSAWRGLDARSASPPAGPAPPPMMTVRLEPSRPASPAQPSAPAVAAPIAPPPMLSLPGSALPMLSRPEPAHVPAARGPEAQPPGPRGGAGAPAAGLPDPMAKPAAPQFVVKNMLGLRAFGKQPAEPPPSPAPGTPDRPLLGLGKVSPSGPAAMERPSPEGSPREPPLGLPERFGRARPQRLSSPTPDRPRPDRRPRSAGAPKNRGQGALLGGLPVWFYVVAGAGALLALAVVVVVVLVQRGRPSPTSARAAVAATGAAAVTPQGTGAAAAADPPPVEAGAPTPQFLVHESPHLRALIEEQLRLVASCRVDPTKCTGWTPLSQAALTPVDARSFVPSSPSTGPLSAWLRRLKVPKDFPLDDNTVLQGIFDYNTKNIAARAEFQQKHFNCSAYEDIFDATLIKYGAPSWLKAVVYQESGCDVVATSPVGAKGLWQFMPESGRAYGLRVSEDEVDQRLDPVKATDAAIHFLTDLKRELGSWDLVLAAYNMGPFGIFSRLTQLGGTATFWDLARAGLLPEETARYVPAIESYALILENLRALNLGGGGKHPQSTAEITVKPGTRLSLIARAAHTSALHIRELNRAYLKDAVPDGETTVWVPDSEAHRAQVFLDTPAPDDSVDTCVPEDFDWGTTVLEKSRYAKKCVQGAPSP